MARRVEQKAAARERIAAQLAAQQQAERRRRLLLAAGAVVLVVVIVGGLIAIRLAGGGKKTAQGASGALDSSLVTALGSIPDSTFATVGSSGVQTAPSAINNQPPLTDNGKPKVLYIGAEYCPFCAAERWPVVVALSRFGTFKDLGTTHSASADVHPNTPSLSFHGSTYTSQYLSFTGVETTTNEVQGNSYKPLDTPSAADQATLQKYDNVPYVSKDSAGSIPFIDLGNKFIGSGATYNPDVLAGKTQAQVVDALKDPSSPITKAVIGSANVYTAAICKLTNNQPAKVCSTEAVTAAAGKLGAAKG
ncbi:thiol-disulfide isomerase/thioredoxin [Kribbella aluminosa]|uniref:Thiol-disulfide isomerase/thioredoxin n=1 Tax=Kribbella aluminosa TaxID=416017 RepID=A0ABS4UN90_9ACTN|nr:DUF929 family protein [Kribbella aluminosa]MBP2353089.1 thiol-disulfide isomerase/thioredoxin [Kribbella aluminosa]